MVGIANFRVMHCNWPHKFNSQFLNIVANDQQLDLVGIYIFSYLKIHIRKNILLSKVNLQGKYS